MFSFLITLLLSVHLLAVNIATGGPLVGAWLDWRGTRGDDLAARAAAYLAKAALHAFAMAALLGLSLGWLKWDETYHELWTGPLSYKLRWAIVEASFSLVLMIVWWWWLPRRGGGSRSAAAARGLIAVLASTNLLYHFPALFAVAARLHGADNLPDVVLKGAAFRALMFAAETPALAVHVTLAAIAVTGLFITCRLLREPSSEISVERLQLARAAGWCSLSASVLQLPVGLWTLMTLSPAAQNLVMGQSTMGTLLLVGSLAAALWLINDLVHLTLGEPTQPLVRRAAAAMLVTVVLMTAMQQQTRVPELPLASTSQP